MEALNGVFDSLCHINHQAQLLDYHTYLYKQGMSCFLTEQLRFKQKSARVTCLELAFEGSIVFIQERMFTWRYELVHLSVGGQTLWRHKFDKKHTDFRMLGDRTAAIVDHQSGAIGIYDLQTRTVREIQMFRNQLLFSHMQKDLQIQYFRESKLICIIEKGTNTSKLNYFSLEGLLEQNHSQTKDILQGLLYTTVYKLNSHSKLGWIKIEICSTRCSVVLSELSSNPTRQIQTYFIDSLRLFQKPRSNLYLCQLQQNSLVLLASSFKRNRFGCLIQATILNIVLLDEIESDPLKPGSTAMSYPLRLQMEGQEYQVGLNHQKFIYCLNGVMVVVSRSKKNSGEMGWSQDELLFVDSTSHQIQCVKTNLKREMKYLVPSWNDQVLVQYRFDYDLEQLIVEYTHIGLPPLKYVSMHLLMHYSQDFDDDLYQDAIELLSGEQ